MRSQTNTDRLRNATRDIHSRLESTEYAAAVMNGTIGIEPYVGYLRVLAVLHGTLESALVGVFHPVTKNVWKDELRRSRELAQDLDYFRMRLIPDAPAAIRTALDTAAELRRLSVDNPVALVGAIYVLYGSSKGAAVIRSRLNSNCGVNSSRGASYFTRHGGEGTREWQETSHRIDSSEIDESGIEAAIETAKLVLQCVHDAFLASHPVDHSALRYTATTLNPDSGDHPVPQDPAVLRVVLHTTDRVLTDYPYILYRYGDRGRRFTDADGGWLVTLPELGEASMAGQLNWLRTVLSSRGVPHILVARHLQLLADELSSTAYDRAYLPLLSGAAERIYRSVDERVPPELRMQQQSVLYRSLGPGSGDPRGDMRCRETAELIASAVVDRDLGVEDAVDAVVGCLADRNRSSDTWVDSVLDTVRVFQTS